MSMKDLHINIHERLDSRLSRLAEVTGEPKSLLIREAVTRYVRTREQELIAEQIRQYAEALSPQSGEFVEETARQVDDVLERDTQW